MSASRVSKDPGGDLSRAKPRYGNRIRGGAIYLGNDDVWACTVAVWNTPEGLGAPDKEWYTDERFDTEEEAWAHYKAKVRPLLSEIYQKIIADAPAGTKFIHQESGLE